MSWWAQGHGPGAPIGFSAIAQTNSAHGRLTPLDRGAHLAELALHHRRPWRLALTGDRGRCDERVWRAGGNALHVVRGGQAAGTAHPGRQQRNRRGLQAVLPDFWRV